jgi:MFS family permease
VLVLAYGAATIAVVALRPIAIDLGGARSVPALAYSLAWLGAACGGIVMGPLAERIGTSRTVLIGAAMIAAGLWIAADASAWRISLGYGVFVGMFGIGAINAPLYIYVTRWFDRRRGSALALLSSGQYLAGALWPTLFERLIDAVGWPTTMRYYGLLVVAGIVPLGLGLLRHRPPSPDPVGRGHAATAQMRLQPRTAFAALCVASVFCCIPMAMPQAHVVALCSDLGIPPIRGAAMLSVLLAVAFVSRQAWGLISDRIGGLRTVLLASICQAIGTAGFVWTHHETGLFIVAAFMGFGFSGIVPAYILAIRELFPDKEAPTRIPRFMLFSGSGMALGGWLAGFLYDHFGFYDVPFGVGLAFNVLNVGVIGWLVSRIRRSDPSDVGGTQRHPAAGRDPLVARPS